MGEPGHVQLGAAIAATDHNFSERDVETVAKALIGTFVFTVDQKGSQTGGKVIETEAYDQCDPDAHCHKDAHKKRRDGCNSMFLSGGHAYYSIKCLT